MGEAEILKEITATLRAELGEGYSSIRTLVTSQGKLLARQAERIAKSRIGGSLKDDDDFYHYLLEGMQTNATNLTRSVVMLSALTLEKAWNAIAGILWKAMRTTLSAAGVPEPLLPQTPPINL